MIARISLASFLVVAMMLLLAVAPIRAWAQTDAATPATPVAEAGTEQAVAAEQPRPARVLVTLTTSEGPIVLELEKDRARATTANFLRYVNEKRFDGGTFYRAINMAEDFGLIQAGVAAMKPGQKLPPPIKHEPTTQTGLTHKTGTVSMARREVGTAQSDFFITVGNMSSLDARPDQSGDNAGFAAFGQVVEGMDVVLKIMRAPISPTLGEKEGMAGQMLENPVTILTARRIERP